MSKRVKPDMEEYLGISETAARYGISPHTLRYYDKAGLLPPTMRGNGGNRLFGAADLEWLELILGLKQTGMSLKDIQAFVATMHEPNGIATRLAVLKRQRQKVAEEIKALKKAAKLLEEKCALYETALETGEIPENSVCRAFLRVNGGEENGI